MFQVPTRVSNEAQAFEAPAPGACCLRHLSLNSTPQKEAPRKEGYPHSLHRPQGNFRPPSAVKAGPQSSELPRSLASQREGVFTLGRQNATLRTDSAPELVG